MDRALAAMSLPDQEIELEKRVQKEKQTVLALINRNKALEEKIARFNNEIELPQEKRAKQRTKKELQAAIKKAILSSKENERFKNSALNKLNAACLKLFLIQEHDSRSVDLGIQSRLDQFSPSLRKFYDEIEPLLIERDYYQAVLNKDDRVGGRLDSRTSLMKEQEEARKKELKERLLKYAKAIENNDNGKLLELIKKYKPKRFQPFSASVQPRSLEDYLISKNSKYESLIRNLRGYSRVPIKKTCSELLYEHYYQIKRVKDGYENLIVPIENRITDTFKDYAFRSKNPLSNPIKRYIQLGNQGAGLLFDENYNWVQGANQGNVNRPVFPSGEDHDFRNYLLAGAYIYGPHNRCHFDNAILAGTKIQSGSNFSYSTFQNSDMRKGRFMGVNFEGADFRGADLRGAFFNNCQLNGASFEGAKTYDIHIRGAELHGSSGFGPIQRTFKKALV